MTVLASLLAAVVCCVWLSSSPRAQENVYIPLHLLTDQQTTLSEKYEMIAEEAARANSTLAMKQAKRAADNAREAEQKVQTIDQAMDSHEHKAMVHKAKKEEENARALKKQAAAGEEAAADKEEEAAAAAGGGKGKRKGKGKGRGKAKAKGKGKGKGKPKEEEEGWVDDDD